MTTPTPDNPPAPDQAADTQAQHDSDQDQALRQLAAQINKMVQQDPTAVIRKAIISGVNSADSPPTVSLNISGDTNTLVSEVRLLNNYTPLIGNTVLLVKQGSEIFILGALAASSAIVVGTTGDGWIQATLAAGSHGGNSNGNVFYRRILDHGSWKMQWRGGWNVSGTTMVTALGADYRPSSKRSVLAAREVSGGSNVVQFDFQTSGAVNLVGGLTTGAGSSADTSSASPGTNSAGVTASGDTDGASAGTAHFHFASLGGGSHSHTVNSHWHNGNGHQHAVSAPGWVSLNGVEYFL